MKTLCIPFLAVLLLSTHADETLAQVRVRKSAGQKTSIDMSGLSTSGNAGLLFRRTLEADLAASGWFQPAASGAALRILGSVTEKGGQLAVECRVFNTGTQAQEFGQRYREAAEQVRSLAHRVADDIVLQLTGHRGMASARLVLLGNRTGIKELYLMDSDGHGLMQLTRDGRPCVGPRWGPDNSVITYTGYLHGFPDIFQIELASGRRTVLSRKAGLNTGAAISPDGRSLALVLSTDGNPELYVQDMRSGKATRLTRTPMAAEASPSWSPDGQHLVYVSDAPGAPHLYVISRHGGAPRRLPSSGRENVSPDWGPNGLIASSARMGGRYEICVTDPNSLQVRILTGGDADYEDPSWAPNGRHIAAMRTVNYRSSIVLLDTQGDPPRILTSGGSNWYAPDWSN